MKQHFIAIASTIGIIVLGIILVCVFPELYKRMVSTSVYATTTIVLTTISVLVFLTLLYCSVYSFINDEDDFDDYLEDESIDIENKTFKGISPNELKQYCEDFTKVPRVVGVSPKIYEGYEIMSKRIIDRFCLGVKDKTIEDMEITLSEASNSVVEKYKNPENGLKLIDALKE